MFSQAFRVLGEWPDLDVTAHAIKSESMSCSFICPVVKGGVTRYSKYIEVVHV